MIDPGKVKAVLFIFGWAIGVVGVIILLGIAHAAASKDEEKNNDDR